MKLFFEIITVVFEPFLVSFLTVLVVLHRSGLGSGQNLYWIVLSLVLGGVPPAVVLVYEKRKGLISDWFIAKREERYHVELAWVFGSLLLTLAGYFTSAPKGLLAIFLIYFVLGSVFTLINHWWKISVHAAMITLFVLVLILFESPLFLLASSLIFLVDYSRLYLQRHTLTQLSVGTLLTLIIAYGVFYSFGLATF